MLLNKDGTPRVFYYGTALENGDFTVFDESKAKKKLGLGMKALGKGNYFTSVDLKNSGRYGKGRIIDAYLHLNQPVIVDGESYKDVVNRILNDDISKYSDDDVQKMLRDKGYDGVILVTPDGNRIVNVFDSENIKSATDNIGTFDGGNEDIRFSIAPRSPREMLHNEIAGLSDEELKRRGLLTYRRNIDKYNDLRQQREDILDAIGTLTIDGKGRATTILDRVADAGKCVTKLVEETVGYNGEDH